MNIQFTKVNLIRLCLLLSISSSACSQEKVSTQTFPAIALSNKIDFVDPKFDQPRFSCGFLLKYKADTFAVTAKHLLKHVKNEEMKTLTFANNIKNWSLFPLDQKQELVVTDKLLNENKAALLEDASVYDEDWLLFSIKSNSTHVKPLSARTTPLIPGEKLFVLGWTRKMETGSQRVYEFEYYKTIGNRILLKDVVVPEKFGGLSGGPVIDQQGLVVGLVSGATTDPDTDKKYFSPCSLEGLIKFIDGNRL
ncbi:trypsin-like serine protease [Pedobacter sp. MC2016-14]|uniref:trypsin-like serine protease n=1 Tax=Pedobacter sp. MC2016-14 TaxID=2897327 RepID=UPI001E53FED8|nr:trypsin-like serine protease [Pedobacter sp. MC2016-14]MCD0489534.1 trypsin-like serine protease [Pedobacter sp. MC2016-14]